MYLYFKYICTLIFKFCYAGTGIHEVLIHKACKINNAFGASALGRAKKWVAFLRSPEERPYDVSKREEVGGFQQNVHIVVHMTFLDDKIDM